MKKVLSKLMGLALMMVVVGCMNTTVLADTSLSSLSVTIKNSDGTVEDVVLSPSFSPEVTEYTATVKSSINTLYIDAVANEASAVVKTEWTYLDIGANKTYVKVTDSTGATATYTISTQRLTAEEEATYVAEEATTENTETESEDSSANTVKVSKVEMKILNSIPESDIPTGFVEDTYTYKGTEYPCIKGERKALIALYMKNTEDDTKDFYIYNEEKDSFYKMNNINIKSRMYTIVTPEKKDSCVKNYTKKKVTIIDKEVKAWELDAEQGLYLVYAMNWNGDVNLYCYDSQEECFQRYIADNDVNVQLKAANKSYNKLQKKYNSLVYKYNILVKIVAGLVIVIIILILVIFNLILKNKEKKLTDDDEDYEEEIDSDGQKLGFFLAEDPEPEMEQEEEAQDESDVQESEPEQGMYIDITDQIKKEMEEKQAETENEVSEEFHTDPATEEVKENKEDTKDEIEDADDDFVFIDLD